MAEEEEDAILICHRVVDLPIPYVMGEVKTCTEGCLERVWVANSSPKGVRAVCGYCAKKLIAADGGEVKLMSPTARQTLELLGWIRGTKR